jgi:NADH:ubiquinone oxidoreductase subunit 4 (subunit M)
VILAAWYAARFYQASMLGPETPAAGDRADLTRGEALLLAPLLAAIVIIGLAPGLITGSLFAWLGTLRLP